MTTTEAEEAWAAGLFEGEGHISLAAGNVGGPKIYSQMLLGLTDLDVLERFQRIVGVGQIYSVKADPRGHGRWKQLYRWQSGGFDAAQHVYKMFEPYLGVRRTEQFTIALVRPPHNAPGASADVDGRGFWLAPG